MNHNRRTEPLERRTPEKDAKSIIGFRRLVIGLAAVAGLAAVGPKIVDNLSDAHCVGSHEVTLASGETVSDLVHREVAGTAPNNKVVDFIQERNKIADFTLIRTGEVVVFPDTCS